MKLCQGSKCLSRSDQQKFIEQLQQLGGIGEYCKLPHWGLVTKMLFKCTTLFGVRYKQIVKLEV